jgi:hypothetical protein
MPKNRKRKEDDIQVPSAIRTGIVENPFIPRKHLSIIVGSGINAVKELKKLNNNLPIL